MALAVITAKREHLFNSTVVFLLSIINETSGAAVTGQSPTIAIRRASDGFFFNGTAFVDTLGVPTPLALTEIGSTIAPGLYLYSFVDPGPIVPTPPTLQLTKDTYQLNFINAGAPPTGGMIWDVREFSRELRDFNTQGS